jgi:hypothetical protein
MTAPPTHVARGSLAGVEDAIRDGTLSALGGGSLLAVSDLTRVIKAIVTATDTEIVAATAGQTIRLHRIRIQCAGANVLTFKSAATAISEPFTFYGPGSMFLEFSSRPYLVTTIAEALNLTTTTTAAVDLMAEYVKSA